MQPDQEVVSRDRAPVIGQSAPARLRAEFDGAFSSESTFRAWYDATLPRVYGYLLSRCGDASLAEDLTQATYVDAVRGRRRFQGQSEIVTWLCGIARHHLADHYRRQERDASRFRKLVNALPEATDPGEWRGSDQRDAVARALATLPPMQRLVLVLCYIDGLSVAETAHLAGKSESATESLLARARETFRDRFPEVGDV